jgi:hypothetical protein
MINIFFGEKICIHIFCHFGDVLCNVNEQQKKLSGLVGLAGSVKRSRLWLRTESLVAKPAKLVAKSNTTSVPRLNWLSPIPPPSSHKVPHRFNKKYNTHTPPFEKECIKLAS